MKNKNTIYPPFFNLPDLNIIIKKTFSASLLVLSMCLLNVISVHAQETIGVYVSAPGVQEFNLTSSPPSPVYNPTTENFNGFSGLPNTTWANPSYSSSIGTYVQTTGDSQVQVDDQYGSGTGNYMSVGDGGVVTLELNDDSRYFGFAWPAGNGGNTIEVLRNGVSLFTMNTDDVVSFLPNNSTSRTALNGNTYTTDQYYGKPGTGQNSNEPYAYIHILASSGLNFDEVRISHSGGGRFENDNHTVLFTGDQPDPDGDDLDWIEVYTQTGPDALDDESLDNNPGDAVNIDVLNNDTPGESDNETFTLDPSTVAITGTTPSGSTLSSDGRTLTVPGEGEWTVNSSTGVITFTPESEFLGDPTPIQYRVSDSGGIASNIANVTVTYTTFVDANDDSAGPVDGATGADDVLNVLDNDELDGEILDPNDVTLTEVDSDDELTFNSDGSIDVDPGTPGGTYTVDYQICEVDEPENCDTATATVTVTSTVTIEITGGACWRMLSSPVEGVTYEDMLDDFWTQGVPGSDDPSSDIPNVYTWSPTSTGNDVSNWVEVDLTDTDPIPAGNGFLFGVMEEDSDDLPKTITVTGMPRTGPVSADINSNSNGWSLVGNPYSSGVKFSELTTNDLTDVAYIWDRNSANWVSTTTDGYGDITDGVIVPGQGFFVQNISSATTPSLEFTESAQESGGEFYGKEEEPLSNFVRLEVAGDKLSSSIWVRFSDNGSMKTTYGDALKLEPLSDDYAMFASRKQDGTLLDIGHFPILDEELQIPLSFTATQPGSYTITADQLDLPVEKELIFTDTQTGQSFELNESFEYTFSVSPSAKKTQGPDEDDGLGYRCTIEPQKAKGSGQDRFLITDASAGVEQGEEIPTELTLSQNYPNPFNPTTSITYQVPTDSNVNLTIYNMSGRKVATLVDGQVSAGQQQVQFNGNQLASGVYMYRLTAINSEGRLQVLTKKLTLIK